MLAVTKRFRRRKIVRSLRLPEPLFVLDPDEIRADLEFDRAAILDELTER